MVNPHEAAFVEAFIVKQRRERASEFLANPKNRDKFTAAFDHHGRNYFLAECIRPFPARHQHPSHIKDMLESLGAPATCHVIGGVRDGEEVELFEAFKEVVGYGMGTVLSCVPGRLAYFEGEMRERFILLRE